MEQQIQRLPAQETFEKCEALWKEQDGPQRAREIFEREYAGFDSCTVALDDDPTGVQTVHDIDVYTSWDEKTLRGGFDSGAKLFFVLTNSRSFSEETTREAHAQIARNIAHAVKEQGRGFVLVSRGDSTLRGHYPLEVDTLRETLAQEGVHIDGELLCPYFKEGGRFTADGVHYVKEGEFLTPAAQTEFAADRTFGYANSFLPAYMEEKSGGRIRAEDVICVTLKELRSLDLESIERRILSAQGYVRIAADALCEEDVQLMAVVLMRLMKKGRRYLIRSAAAVPKVFGAVPDRPLLTRSEMVDPGNTNGGLVVVGSHVKKTTAQLECLKRSEKNLRWIEFDVNGWQREGGLEAEGKRVCEKAAEAIRSGATAVVYTSRTLAAPEGASPEELLALSVRISDAVTNVVAQIGVRPRFLIAKGGITSSDIGTKALRVTKARVLGQAQPGIPVWQIGEESLFPALSYIIFPGNVGGEETLRTIVEELA